MEEEEEVVDEEEDNSSRGPVHGGVRRRASLSRSLALDRRLANLCLVASSSASFPAIAAFGMDMFLLLHTVFSFMQSRLAVSFRACESFG